MLKQQGSRLKTVLTILLVVLFFVSLTAVASSAESDQKHDHLNQDQLGGHDHHHHNNHDECLVWNSTKQDWVWIC
jgi:hypothetical protein